MFEHLDDPNPPPPRALLIELVVAEGARRRRRRAVIAGGLAASLLVMASCVRVAHVAGSERDLDVDLVPVNTPLDSRREAEEMKGGISGRSMYAGWSATDQPIR